MNRQTVIYRKKDSHRNSTHQRASAIFSLRSLTRNCYMGKKKRARGTNDLLLTKKTTWPARYWALNGRWKPTRGREPARCFLPHGKKNTRFKRNSRVATKWGILLPKSGDRSRLKLIRPLGGGVRIQESSWGGVHRSRAGCNWY